MKLYGSLTSSIIAVAHAIYHIRIESVQNNQTEDGAQSLVHMPSHIYSIELVTVRYALVTTMKTS